MAVTMRIQASAKATVSGRGKQGRRSKRCTVAVRAAEEPKGAGSTEETGAVGMETPAVEPIRMQATVVASQGSGGLIDPADGTIAEAAPLGNDNSLLDNFWSVFKDQRSMETLNGRSAMVGFTFALIVELQKNTSLLDQITSTRTFNMYDGTQIVNTVPAVGAFLIPLTVLLVFAGSVSPMLKGWTKSGLTTAPDNYGPFRAEAEVLNGRAAMMGLPMLVIAERLMGGGALF
jgi:hypothetical protein